MANYPKYEEDFYGWVMANAQLMREGKMSEIDIENLIEEVESMGRSEKHQLVNRLSVLIAHLLKWQYQPQEKGHSWLYTIREQREQISMLLTDNPSLKPKSEDALVNSYKIAVLKAAKDTNLDRSAFPSICPFSFDQCLDDEFYPE